MNSETKKYLMDIKGEVTALLADLGNGMTKDDVVIAGYLFGLIDDIILENFEKDDECTDEDVVLSRMYEIYAMITETRTSCMQTLKKMINRITEVL